MRVIRKLRTRLERDQSRHQVARAVMPADKAIQQNARSQFDGRVRASLIHYFRAIGTNRFRRAWQHRDREQSGLRDERRQNAAVLSHDAECRMEAAQEQAAVQANTQHVKALLASLNQVLVTRGDDAAVFSMRAKRLLDGL